MDISHEKSVTILSEKDKYERMKDNLRSENEKYMSNDISWNQCSCKATYKIKDLSEKLINISCHSFFFFFFFDKKKT